MEVDPVEMGDLTNAGSSNHRRRRQLCNFCDGGVAEAGETRQSLAGYRPTARRFSVRSQLSRRCLDNWDRNGGACN